MHSFVSFLFSNNLDEENRVQLGYFALIVFPMSCHCKCSIALSLGAVGGAAVRDCRIS